MLHSFLVALLVTVLPITARSANLTNGYYTEDRVLTSPTYDATGTHYFAISAAVSSGVALVGSPGDSGSEAAYLYNAHTGALLHTLTPESSAGQSFGRYVALDGNYAVVSSTVATYVYDVHSYQLLHTLPRGSAVDIDQGRAIIASWGFNYVYDLASGIRLATLNSNSSATSVAISGDYAIIGKVGDGLNPGPGLAWVFDWKKNQQPLYDLAPSSLSAGAGFGVSVAADGNIVVVGSGIASAYLFDLTTGELLHRLEGSLSDSLTPEFGYSVAIHGDMAFVGAFRQGIIYPDGPTEPAYYHFDRGVAYAFSVQTGDEIARFTTSGPKTNGLADYGFSLDYDGSQLIAGTLGYPKLAYLTDFAIPEPSSLQLDVALVVSMIVFGAAKKYFAATSKRAHVNLAGPRG